MLDPSNKSNFFEDKMGSFERRTVEEQGKSCIACSEGFSLRFKQFLVSQWKRYTSLAFVENIELEDMYW